MPRALPPPPSEMDVVVIGGGANGTGVARDCALRGLRVALLERNGWGFGAAGHSSGFLRGGLRHLLADPRATRESIEELGVLQRIAPHLVSRIPLVIPQPREGRAQRSLVDAFFDLYERYQALKRGDKNARLSAAELQDLFPGLVGDYAGAVILEEWGIDGTRLSVANAVDAEEHGAWTRTHTPVTEILRGAEGEIRGVRYLDALTGAEGTVDAGVVVNATGAWSPLTLGLAGLEPSTSSLRPRKGIHIYLERQLVSHGLIVRAIDDQPVFVFPWQNTTVIGCTDTEFYGDLEGVTATTSEVQYLMQAVARVLPSLRQARAIGTVAGVWPTPWEWGKGPDTLSGEPRLIDHQADGVGGLYSLIGGRLGSYRLLAEQVTDRVMARLGRSGVCETAVRALPGGDRLVEPELLASVGGMEPAAASRLAHRHGSRSLRIADRMVKQRSESEPICTCEAVTEAEIHHVVEEERARTVADVSQLTRLGLGACGGMRCVGRCAIRVAQLTDRPADEAHRSAREFLVTTARGRMPVLGPEQAQQEAITRAATRSELGEELP